MLWHPVTSEIQNLKQSTNKLVNFVNNSNYNFIVIYSNNDPGTKIILNCYKKKLDKKKNKLFQSIRFENFYAFLKMLNLSLEIRVLEYMRHHGWCPNYKYRK